MTAKAYTDQFSSICPVCGLEVWSGEVMIRSESHGRRAGYFTHAQSITDPAHQERLQEMERFFDALDQLAVNLTSQCTASDFLKEGQVMEVDLGYVLPDAHTAYALAVPDIKVNWNHGTEDVQIAAIDVWTADVPTVVADIQSAADAAALAMSDKFKVGKL